MSQSPTTHAACASSSLSQRLAAARADESGCAQRLASIEADIALYRARLGDHAPREAEEISSPALTRQRFVLEQRVCALEALRTTMIVDRARRRREIDEMAQRKEAIDAALAVLRARAGEPLAVRSA